MSDVINRMLGFMVVVPSNPEDQYFSLVEGKEYVDPLKALPAAAASTLKRPGKEFHDSKGQIVQALASLEDEGPVKLTRLSGL